MTGDAESVNYRRPPFLRPFLRFVATSRRRSRPLTLPQESRPPAPENRPLSRFRTPSDPPNSPARGGSRPPPELTLARPGEDLSKRSKIRRSGSAWHALIACGPHSVRSAKIFEVAGGPGWLFHNRTTRRNLRKKRRLFSQFATLSESPPT